MIFHMGFELPEPVSTALDHEASDLTLEEIKILRRQIQRNSLVIGEHVTRLDLLVNKERYPRRAVFIEKIRRRLELLMEENDTFRKTLWRHHLQREAQTQKPRAL